MLAEGKWVKIRVKNNGIKQLSRATLASWGFNNIDKIAVYGNGGAELPLRNSDFRHADLVRLPVVRTGSSVLFYADGVENWQYANGSYSCRIHQYDDYSYYFITESDAPSADAEIIDDSGLAVVDATSVYDSRAHHEQYKVNVVRSGKQWFGETLTAASRSTSIALDLPQRTSESDTIILKARLGASSTSVPSYSISFNGTTIKEGTTGTTSSSSTSGEQVKVVDLTVPFAAASPTRSNVSVAFRSDASNAKLYIGHVTLLSRSTLDMSGKSMLQFRYAKNVGADGTTQYNVSGCSANVICWDVTDCTSPKALKTSFANGTMSIVRSNDALHELVVFDPSGSFEEPQFVEAVANQNLRAMASVNYIIICPPVFRQQAERLAALHRQHSNISVEVASTDQIYNEFASGKREPAAIRDFIKHLYDQEPVGSDNALRYALLFGDGSFDNRTTGLSNQGNQIPTYQSDASTHVNTTYVTDDFYAWLDPKEAGSYDTYNNVDIGIGRFPVQTVAQAEAAVNKSERYLTQMKFGPWRKHIVLVSDDGDKNEHASYADSHAKAIESDYNVMDVTKIYLESYTSQNTAAGVQYPQAHIDLINSINEGCVLANYVGHGSPRMLSDHALFQTPDIKSLNNVDMLPFFITATCDFAPFDHPEPSCGEESFLYEHGGFIGLLTTTRLVYGDSNYRINREFLKYAFARNAEGRRYTMGEAAMMAKRNTSNLSNSLKYWLVGDPAITLAATFDYVVTTDQINGVPAAASGSLTALATSTIEGSVRDAMDNVAEQFNGQVYVTLYDKKVTRQTSGAISGASLAFDEYRNVLYSGIANVRNGRFAVSFTLSKDINYEVGQGRISYYAVASDNTEAAGADNTIKIGGSPSTAQTDTVGPQITAWVDFEQFVNGGTTGATPIIYANMTDASGINHSGSGVGHDITIVVDGNRAQAINANRSFSYNENSYTDGRLKHQLYNLADGKHTITIKAWDNANNSSDTTLTINVNAGSRIAFGNVALYPQPFTPQSGSLKLTLAHNEGGKILKLKINLYSINGRIIDSKTITTIASDIIEVNLTDEMPCVGTLSSGIYIIKAELTSDNGRHGTISRKLSIGAQ